AAKGTLADLSRCDCIIVTGTDPAVSHPVASMLIKRAVDRGCRLIVIEDQETGLASYADQVLKTGEVNQAVGWARRSQCPVVVHGDAVLKKTLRLLQQLDNVVFVALQPGVNTYAAVSLGLNQRVDFSALEVLYVLAGKQNESLEEVAAKIAEKTFVVVQASYASALTERADLVLPMAAWQERSGTLTNTDGIEQPVQAAGSPQGQSKPDWEILRMLTEMLGGAQKISMDHILRDTAQEFCGKENPSWQK
ncbi:MAG: molybdopterin-dependent oxidoreductase, partial [Desulfobacterales bacterium]